MFGFLKKFPILIRCCWFGINHLFREKISGISLTTVQYTVLRSIYDCLPNYPNQREVAALISTNQNNLSSILNRLEEVNYIRILENPLDKRANQIKLSKKGKQTFLSGKKKADELQKSMTRIFKQSEVKVLSDYLIRINKKIPD